MRKLLLIFLTLMLSVNLFGQTIKIQGGTTYSYLVWPSILNISFYDKPFLGCSGLIGLDYCNRNVFNLSSNIGLVQKGGKDKITVVDSQGNAINDIILNAYLDYLLMNSTIDFKYAIKEKVVPYISFGPRIDFLISYSDAFKGLDAMNELNKISLGLTIGAGIRYEMLKFQIGLKGEYFLNFNKIADWPASTGNLGGSISDRTMMVNLTVGYKLE